MPVNVSIDTGRFTAGKIDVIFTPHRRRPGPVVVYLHSGAGLAAEAFPTSPFTAIQAHLRNLVEKLGVTIVCPTQPLTFGNGAAADTGGTTCQGALTDAIAYHRANLLGSTAPVILLGTSMGSTTALRRAGLAPATVAGVVTFLAVPDLTIVYASDLGGFGAAVGTAYGVTSPTPLPALTCPTHQLSDSVPKLITHSTDDLFTTSVGHVTETEMASGRGATFLTTGAVGHTNASAAAVPLATVANFVGTYV